MIYALIAFGILVVVGALVATARTSGKKEVENDDLRKTNAVQKQQIDIASREPASPNDLLARMSKDDL